MLSRKRILVGTVLFLALMTVLGFLATLPSSAGSAPLLSPAPVAEPLLSCGACHTMTAEVTAWDQGAHSTLACLQCHLEGDPGWIRHEFAERQTDMAAHSVAAEPHTIQLKLDGQRCEQCHAPQMTQILNDIQPAPLQGMTDGALRNMDVKAAHDLHVNGRAALACVDCHSVHGAAPGSQARQAQAHRTCQECHDRQQVQLKPTGDTSCTACHLDETAILPADHKPAAQWLRQHGTSAATQNCTQCHASDSACVSCHAGEPMPHPAGFLTAHGQRAITAPAICTTCHSAANPAGPDSPHATPQFCADCHRSQPMPHPDAYLSAHGADALKAPAVCQNCHTAQNPANPTAFHASAAFCASCHDAYRHPAGWVANHGPKVDDGCAACHSVEPGATGHAACAACHTGSGSWHPDMWFVSHGRVVNRDGKAACMQCHNEVQPSCTQCHKNP